MNNNKNLWSIHFVFATNTSKQKSQVNVCLTFLYQTLYVGYLIQFSVLNKPKEQATKKVKV